MEIKDFLTSEPKEIILEVLKGLSFVCITLLVRDFPPLQVFVHIVSLIPKELAVLAALISTSLLLIVLIAYKPSPTDYIARFNLRWKKSGKKLDSHPFCLCCETPRPLKIGLASVSTSNIESLFCPVTNKPIAAVNDNKIINYKEAYKLLLIHVKNKDYKSF